MCANRTIFIRGEDWEEDYVLSMLNGLQNRQFQKQRWTSRDALVANDGSRATIYTGQAYDPESMTLHRNFWDHDHCEVCNWSLSDSEGEEHATGYFNGYNWLCEECHRLFIQKGLLKS